MKLRCTRITQNGKPIYVGVMRAEELCDTDKVVADVWRGQDEGYQRAITNARAEDFGNYLLKSSGISPLVIYLSIRDNTQVSFSPEHELWDEAVLGTLIFPDDMKLWEVDGQHRVAGLRYAIDQDPSFARFPMPVSIIVPSEWGPGTDPVFEEAVQFGIVNKTAKGIRADLVDRLVARIKDTDDSRYDYLPKKLKVTDWIDTAIKVVDILNRESPVWMGKIKPPNDTSRGKKPISERSFTQSLRPVFTSSLIVDETPEVIAKMLDLYWQAARDLCPEAFDNPADYVIQRTTGVYVLHDVFVKALLYLKRGEKVTKSSFLEVLQDTGNLMTAEYWSSRGFAGMAGTGLGVFSRLSSMAKDELEKANTRTEYRGAFKL